MNIDGLTGGVFEHDVGKAFANCRTELEIGWGITTGSRSGLGLPDETVIVDPTPIIELSGALAPVHTPRSHILVPLALPTVRSVHRQVEGNRGKSVKFGMIISDVPREVDPLDQLDGILRQVEAGQRNGLTNFVIGQHFLYGELRWLQPIPLLARLAAELDEGVRVGISVVLSPLYNPIVLAEELATLDIVTRGHLDVGVGLGYRSAEFGMLNVPFNYRVSRLEEGLEVMKLCWAMEDFDYQGKHWQIEGATPHIACVQQPHPPIWIGAHSRAGARRAGRLGDSFVIPPEYDIAEMRIRLGIMAAGFEERGKAMGHQPLRRNAFVGKTTDEAIASFVDVSKDRYLTYARNELDILDEAALMSNYYETVKDSVAVGTAQEVIDHFIEVARELPIDPIIIKPQWPQMPIDSVIEELDKMGQEVIPALAEVAPMPIEDIPASFAPAADEIAAALEEL